MARQCIRRIGAVRLERGVIHAGEIEQRADSDLVDPTGNGDDPRIRRMADAYLEVWSDLADPTALPAAVDPATRHFRHDELMPQQLSPSRWEFDPGRWPDDDCVAIGADLAPSTLIAAYSAGAFPMPVDDVAPMVWWSPLRRGILRLDDLRVSRSLRRSVGKYEIRLDTAFDAVIEGCADPSRPGAWINHAILAAYRELFEVGWAHSIETWTPGGELAGGLYGVAIGGLFAGESMFYRQRDASKVSLVGLVDLLRDEYADRRLIDVQWRTPHLSTLGVTELDRDDYLARLPALVNGVPLPEPWR